MAARERLRLQAPPASPRPLPAPPAPRTEAPSRARPLPLGLPLSDLHLRRIAELEELVGRRYLGWVGLPDHAGFAVDVADPDVDLSKTRAGTGEGVDRYTGDTLHLALAAAIRAAKGQP